MSILLWVCGKLTWEVVNAFQIADENAEKWCKQLNKDEPVISYPVGSRWDVMHSISIYRNRGSRIFAFCWDEMYRPGQFRAGDQNQNVAALRFRQVFDKHSI